MNDITKRLARVLPATALAGAGVLALAVPASADAPGSTLECAHNAIAWQHLAGIGYSARSTDSCATNVVVYWDIKQNGADWHVYGPENAQGSVQSPYYQATRGAYYQAEELFYLNGKYVGYLTSGAPVVLAQ